MKRMADIDDNLKIGKNSFIKSLGEKWALSISQLLEGVENPEVVSLSKLKLWISFEDGKKMLEMRLRMEKEIEDTEFRLERGSDLGRFDQF